jgi:hypothetical protein
MGQQYAILWRASKIHVLPKPEGEGIYKARCDEWDTVTEHVRSQLLAVCTGEPGIKLLGIADKDGKGAWRSGTTPPHRRLWLVHNTTTSTIMAGLEALLDSRA